MDSNARKFVNILGIKTHSTSKDRVLRFVQNSLKKNKKFIITTPNPEIVLKAQNDEVLRRILNDSDISLPDGVGLAVAKRFLGYQSTDNILIRVVLLFPQLLAANFSYFISNRQEDYTIIKGREMFIDLIKLSNKRKYKVFLLGGDEEVACNTAEILSRSYKGVKFKCESGAYLDKKGLPIDNENKNLDKKAIKAINEFRPDILFVAFGAPKQEKWIDRHINELEIGGAMVVGGTFDYITGKLPLPPNWISSMGLEWMWRLIVQPSRFIRIVNAVIVFQWKLLIYKLFKDR